MTARESSPSTEPQPTSVLLIDDHQLVTGALQVALEREDDFVVRGVAETIAEGLVCAAELQPALIITDLRLPDGDVHDHLDRFADVAPGAKVLVLTGWPTERSFLACVTHRAAGYVAKTKPLSEVVSAARRVANGDAVLPFEYVGALLSGPTTDVDDNDRPRLTLRELDVLQALARGQSTTQVADTLMVSVNTVRNHLASAMHKLGKSSRLAAVSEAVSLGLISLPTTQDR